MQLRRQARASGRAPDLRLRVLALAQVAAQRQRSAIEQRRVSEPVLVESGGAEGEQIVGDLKQPVAGLLALQQQS